MAPGAVIEMVGAVTNPDKGVSADTAMGITNAATNAKTVTKTNNFFISSPILFLCFLFFRVSQYTLWFR
jgi:hypothetical protein